MPIPYATPQRLVVALVCNSFTPCWNPRQQIAEISQKRNLDSAWWISRPADVESVSLLSVTWVNRLQRLENDKMAARSWETDFRFSAIQASARVLGDAHRLDPFQFPGSFCLPVAERPIVGWTPGRVSLIAIILGFTLLGAGVLLATTADNAKTDAGGMVMLAIAACCSFSGILTFFVPAKLDRQIVSWLIGGRGHELVQRSNMANVMAAELSDADRSKMKITIDGDDHVLIRFDEENRRLMIEGIGARYQVRAADVEKVEAFEFLK